MKIYKGNILGLSKDGELIVFESRKDYDNNVHKLKRLARIYASASYLLRSLRSDDNKMKLLEEEVERLN